MPRQPNPNRKNSPSMLAKTTKLRLDKHRKALTDIPNASVKRTGNESDDQLINRILDHYEISNKPAEVGISTYTRKQIVPSTTV